jgi:hypothetical protein
LKVSAYFSCTWKASERAVLPVAKPWLETYASDSARNTLESIYLLNYTRSEEPGMWVGVLNCSDLLFFIDGMPELQFGHPNDYKKYFLGIEVLKGVRYGDTGLSATGNCFRE